MKESFCELFLPRLGYSALRFDIEVRSIFVPGARRFWRQYSNLLTVQVASHCVPFDPRTKVQTHKILSLTSIKGKTNGQANGFSRGRRMERVARQ